ncbi:MAG: RNA polymerase sigma factor [Burkholderiaceae bacterium]|nr:RNA polymerase sigma factor [Burkholderiaceae bacterium]
MDNKALERFLTDIERRAFKIAMLGVQDEQVALDMVQEAMMRLAEKYADRSPEEWPMLFHRILQNAILDHHRRQKVRRAWVSLFGDMKPVQELEDGSESAPELDMPDDESAQPDALLARQQLREQLDSAIAALPIRQQQAFLLRYWEGLDIAQTAQAMGCSEGSVKTHCFRAVKTLSESLAFLQQDFKD